MRAGKRCARGGGGEAASPRGGGTGAGQQKCMLGDRSVTGANVLEAGRQTPAVVPLSKHTWNPPRAEGSPGGWAGGLPVL